MDNSQWNIKLVWDKLAKERNKQQVEEQRNYKMYKAQIFHLIVIPIIAFAALVISIIALLKP